MAGRQSHSRFAVKDHVEKESFGQGPDDVFLKDSHRIDDLFYRICRFCFFLGVNFYPDRSFTLRCISLSVLICIYSINLYFIGFVAFLTLNKPFELERVATSASICSWMLQATLSAIFLAYWQHTGQSIDFRRMLYNANKGAGIHHYKHKLSSLLRSFYIVITLWIVYFLIMIVSNLFEVDYGPSDRDIPKIFGHRRFFIIIQLCSLHSVVCWTVAIYLYALLNHATQYEFSHFNDTVRSISCTPEYQTDDTLCDYLLELMKINNRLLECVKRLDKMFHRYAFVMIATIIPTAIFTSFLFVRIANSSSGWMSKQLLFTCPVVLFCIFSFFKLVNSPSRLHTTIYQTKAALCANSNIWFPYRSSVYHSALAFVFHLDQTNLGVSIWGFAVVSKPLVLTTLSVMATCLALFLQVGECNTGSRIEPTPHPFL